MNCRKCVKPPFCDDYGKENCSKYINIISAELDKIDREAEERRRKNGTKSVRTFCRNWCL